MPPINYRNLLANKCPKCKKELWFDKSEEMIMCTYKCGFMIHKDKMESICVSMTLNGLANSAFLDSTNSGENGLQSTV